MRSESGSAVPLLPRHDLPGPRGGHLLLQQMPHADQRCCCFEPEIPAQHDMRFCSAHAPDACVSFLHLLVRQEPGADGRNRRRAEQAGDSLGGHRVGFLQRARRLSDSGFSSRRPRRPASVVEQLHVLFRLNREQPRRWRCPRLLERARRAPAVVSADEVRGVL